MKITDDYNVKYKMWAANPQVIPDIPPKYMPKFGCKRFNSHAEMNAWKESLLREIAEMVPAPDGQRPDAIPALSNAQGEAQTRNKG